MALQGCNPGHASITQLHHLTNAAALHMTGVEAADLAQYQH